MKIRVGTSGFAYKEWKGKFYPATVSAGEMLRFYAEHLRSVEINNTFYCMPTERVPRSWARQVPDDFVFGFKAPGSSPTGSGSEMPTRRSPTCSECCRRWTTGSAPFFSSFQGVFAQI